MTSKKLGIALISLLVLSLFVIAPAMAANSYGVNITTGQTVFIGELGLNVASAATGVATSTGSVTLYHYSGTDVGAAPDKSVTFTDMTSVYIDSSVFVGYTGPWYNSTPGTPPVASFFVADPSIGIALKSAAGDIVSNKKVIDGSDIQIEIDSTLAPLFDRAGLGSLNGITVKIVTPEGATLDKVINKTGFTTDLTNIQVHNNPFFLTENGSTLVWNLNINRYTAGEYKVYAEVNVNSMKDNYNPSSGKTVSATKTITLDKETVTITADKETVIRNNDFSVTVDGAPKTYYYLWISGTKGFSSPDLPPEFTANQADVTRLTVAQMKNASYKTGANVSDDVYNAVGYAVCAKTDANGLITVGLTTTSTTKDSTYTIRAQKLDGTFSTATNYVALDTQLYDTVKVKVEKGAVTVTASGDGSYYLGEEIVLSGTNTDTDLTYMFITGPNLPTNGGMITSPQTAFNMSTGSSDFDKETVKTDDTWEYKWDTSGISLDAGTYTIYAVSDKKDKSALSDAKYDTVSIVVKKPFVTATTSSSTVAKGDKLYIRGTAEGQPTEGVAIWILGKNYWNGAGSTISTSAVKTETVNDDGSFEHELGTADTKNLASGQYFVVVQHPMYNNKFDVVTNNTATNYVLVQENLESAATATTNTQFIIWGTGKLQGSDAAEALIDAINSADVDDTYTKLTFLVEEPWIRINSIGDHYIGDQFKITGTTNLAVDDDLIVEVTSSSFQPTQKTQSGEFSGVSSTVKVTEGTTYNEWSMDIDASTFKADEYIVNVEAIEADVTATTTFNVIKGSATTAPTTSPTSAPTTGPTTGPTTAPTPQPTASPGFGVLVALAGLGAVAALVMRKD